jgi:hypothetical protein
MNRSGHQMRGHPLVAIGEQAVAVLGEVGVVPDAVVDGHADEPAVQQVAAHLLLYQLPLAAHREEDLDEHGAQQLLGGDGGPACVRVNQVEQATQLSKRFIDQRAHRTQRMFRTNEIFQLGHRYQRLCIPSDPRVAFTPT